ncbi:MAG: UDP-N-acetylmuramoyl-tripeptide--D-alanyl-D-alanine ligase [Patescibacteria group bacterium]|nr:UDP-N-acetylmuramoyl-tripeptide--D-alanyl-D-alanine ligase [Patescibacteria group bacterium]
MLRNTLKIWLKIIASKVLNKYKPRIIAITGSTGKTSTKDAISTVMSGKDIAGTKGNMNTEFGVSATIIDPAFTPSFEDGKAKLSIKDVWDLTMSGFRKVVSNVDYPRILVLELAADRPDDIKFFMGFIKPEVAILTNIGDVHLEFFGSKSRLVEEKGCIIASVKRKGLAILNKDDDFSKLVSRRTKSRKVFISANEEADVWAGNIGFGGKGIHFNINSGSEISHIDLPVFGYQFVYAALFAWAVGRYFGVSPELISKRLEQYKVPTGRFEIMRLGKTILIDDTYNANPASVTMALKSLGRLGVNRQKVAVLGDMRELGSAHQKGHRLVGTEAAKVLDQLWVIGKGGSLIRQAAIDSGMPKGKVRFFSEDEIPKILQDNYIVLIKGSRAVHLDATVKQIKEHYERYG